jgi:SAM-dependent methyltransferase
MHDSIQPFLEEQPLSLNSVDRLLRFLATELRNDRLPGDALSEMHAFYDRMLQHERYFLHHFAPYLCEVDETFSVKTTRPYLLDLGCGVGTQASLFAARGARVIGIDNKPERVDAANAMRPWYESQMPRDIDINLEYGDAFQYLADLEPESLDGVYTQFALAYMEPHAEMLRLIHRVVRPGGIVFFREFNAGSIYNKLFSRVNWLSAEKYKQIGESFGWKLKTRKFYWLFPKPLINAPACGPIAIGIENALSNLPIARSLTGSMTLVFERC